MLNVAVLGLGRIGPAHVKTVANTPGVRLVAVAEANEEKLGQVLKDYPGVAAYGDYRSVLERKDVDVVVNCLPHWLHEQSCIDAANVGKHIMVEKPLADSVAECDRIIAAAKKKKITLMVAHTQRYYPVVRRTKEIIESHQLGDLIMAVDMWYKPLNPEQRPKWMLDRSKGGGMMLMDGVHMIDRLLWLIGPDIHRVSAYVGNPVYPEISADDTAMAFLRWKSGVVATISRIAYRTGVVKYGADLFFTKGQLKFRIPYGQRGQAGVWIGRDEEYRPVDVPQWEPLARQLADFVDSLNKGTEAPTTAEHGRQVIQVMEAMERSSATGRQVVLHSRER